MLDQHSASWKTGIGLSARQSQPGKPRFEVHDPSRIPNCTFVRVGFDADRPLDISKEG